MEFLKRYLTDSIASDLAKKMVFLSGPRQVGKTTLAKQLLSVQQGVYLNWDFTDDKKRILAGKWPEKGIVVLDEIHKYRKWKNFIKGHFDKYRDTLSFLITGSARLNIYKKGGDSLQGRYHHYRLHPFTIAEIENATNLLMPFKKPNLDQNVSKDLLDHLMMFGGFPEPFLSANEKTLRRWHKERFDQVIHEDVRDVSNIHDINLIEIFASMLGPRAGSPFSINSVREDLNVSHRTITNWFSILQQLFVCFAVPPYQGKMPNALKKEPKVYLWDWSVIENEGIRLENLVAGHLLKFCHALQDQEGYTVQLWYLRDRQKREVDFLLTCDKKPWMAVEVKNAEPQKTNMEYFKKQLNIPNAYCVCKELKDTFVKDEIIYTPVERFLRALGV
jgi:uncharacterized protein